MPAHDWTNPRCWCGPFPYAVCQRCCVGKDTKDADPDCPLCEGTGAMEADAMDPPPYVLVHYWENDEVAGTSEPMQEFPE